MYRFSLLLLPFSSLYETSQVQNLHIFMVLLHYSCSHKPGVGRFWSWRIFWSWRQKATHLHATCRICSAPALCSAEDPVCSQLWSHSEQHTVANIKVGMFLFCHQFLLSHLGKVPANSNFFLWEFRLFEGSVAYLHRWFKISFATPVCLHPMHSGASNKAVKQVTARRKNEKQDQKRDKTLCFKLQQQCSALLETGALSLG